VEPAPGAAGLLDALAWCALQFSPHVCVLEGAVLLEMQGSVRLFGGETALRARLQACVQAWDQGGRMATAPTALAALAFLRACPGDVHHVDDGTWQTALDACPVHTLLAARAHASTLQPLGCRTLGQLRRLPRGGISRRFGAALLDALDRAYGLKPETYAWVTVPERFCQRLEFVGRIDFAQGMMFGVHRLLLQLQAWLGARHCGVTGVTLHWAHDLQRRSEAPAGSHTVATAQATRDVQHLSRLLAEHLARLKLVAPVVAITLEAVGVEPLPLGSDSLFAEDQHPGESSHQFIERISARLGADRVRVAQPVADHRPHRMQQWRVANLVLAKPSPRLPQTAYAPQASHPPWLLHQPLALAVHRDGRPMYQGPLTLLAGPERIESGWWEQAHEVETEAVAPADLTVRDYFVAQSAHAGMLWIFRVWTAAQGAPRWFLHGIYG